ncbi:MAG: hypothetical protein R2830_21855 [Saprospiraceae bacterium]
MKLFYPFMKYTFYVFALFSLVISCKNDFGSHNIEAFYFPLDKLEDGKVYEYQSVGNPNDPPMYWYYKSMKEGGHQYLLGTSYDTEFSPDQFVREERAANGMLLADFYMYEKDSTGKKMQLRANIEAANVFPFAVKEPAGVLLSSVHWQSLGDSARLSLVRNRQFDKDTTVSFKGKNLSAVKFLTRELVDQETEGHLELEYGGMEVYAKGIGLVYFKKNISEKWQMAYRLADVYDMKDFEEKFKTVLGQQ